MKKKQRAKNLSVAINVCMIVAGMAMLTAASPTLYRTFCAITGFGGTTQVAKTLPEKILERKVTVRFDSNMDANLGWKFGPEQPKVNVKIGENGLAFFTAENDTGQNSVGMATYNVTPEKVGKYFNKIKCFCFDRQPLKNGQRIEFPISFFIDPDFASDPFMDDVDEITLSYTFYKQKE